MLHETACFPALPDGKIRQIIAKLPNTTKGKRDAALLVVGWRGSFRRSELAAVKVEHVRISGDVMRVSIPTSKTDQAGAGKVKTLSRLEDELSDVDPIRCYLAWLDFAQINSGFVYRPVGGWGSVGADRQMDGKEIARTVKAAVESIGLDTRSFDRHSFRHGYVIEANDAGASDSDIAETSGHESLDTLQTYKARRGIGSQRVTRLIEAQAKGRVITCTL